MWDSQFGDKVSTSSVDSMHEIILLHGCLLSGSKADSTGIVDDNVNASEGCDSFVYSFLYTLFISDVALDSKSLASSFLDFFNSGVNSTREFWMRLSCLSNDGNVGA